MHGIDDDNAKTKPVAWQTKPFNAFNLNAEQCSRKVMKYSARAGAM